MSTTLDILQINPREVWIACDSGGHLGLFYNYRYGPSPQSVLHQTGILSRILLELGPRRLNAAVEEANLTALASGFRSCHDVLDPSVSYEPTVLFTRNTALRAFFEEEIAHGWVVVASEHPAPDIVVAQPQAKHALDRLHRADACSGCYCEGRFQGFLEWRAPNLGFYRYEHGGYGDQEDRYTCWGQPKTSPLLANDLPTSVRSALIRISVRFSESPKVKAPS